MSYGQSIIIDFFCFKNNASTLDIRGQSFDYFVIRMVSNNAVTFHDLWPKSVMEQETLQLFVSLTAVVPL